MTTVIKQSDLIVLTTSMEVPGNHVNDLAFVGCIPAEAQRTIDAGF